MMIRMTEGDAQALADKMDPDLPIGEAEDLAAQLGLKLGPPLDGIRRTIVRGMMFTDPEGNVRKLKGVRQYRGDWEYSLGVPDPLPVR